MPSQLHSFLAKLVLVREQDLPRRANWNVVLAFAAHWNAHQEDLFSKDEISKVEPRFWRHVFEEGSIAEFSGHERPGIAFHAQNSTQFLCSLRRLTSLLHDANLSTFVDGCLKPLCAHSPLGCNFAQRTRSWFRALKLFNLGRQIVVRRLECFL